MDGVLAIAVAGLAIALAAALYVIQKRTDDIAALRFDAASRARSQARTEAERVAEETNRAVGTLEALLPVGILHLDGGRRIERANDRAHALLGTKPGRLVGRSVMEAFLDPRAEELIDGVPVGGAATGELRVGDGEPRILVVSAHRPDAGGSLVILEDATELRRLQQIRTEFIDNVSHELRTPLSTVSLLAETLAREAASSDVPARMRERIAKIEVETGHLVQMVSELLDLARIEGGGQLAFADDVDVGRLAESSIERLRLFAERNGVRLLVDAEPGLPTIRADESRLGQVFVNLVHNAIKFSPDGGEVRVSVRAEGGEIVIHVVDHGTGIAKADQNADLRALLQGRPGARARRRDGPRPLDRAARRRGPRRADLGRVGGGSRLDVLVRDPDRARDNRH